MVDVLFNKKVIRYSMKRIQSKLPRIGTYSVFKISLPCFDYKKYVLDDGFNSLAYFHKDIKVSYFSFVFIKLVRKYEIHEINKFFRSDKGFIRLVRVL